MLQTFTQYQALPQCFIAESTPYPTSISHSAKAVRVFTV